MLFAGALADWLGLVAVMVVVALIMGLAGLAPLSRPPPAPQPAAQTAAPPAILRYSHRTLHAAAIGPDGRLWTSEHGPQGGAEIHHPEAGKSHG